MIYRANSDSLKPLHHLLFKTFGQSAHIKKNIRKLNGFAFEADAEECAKKTDKLSKMTMPELKEFCGWLSLEKSGSKEEVVKRILVFLLRPVVSAGVGEGHSAWGNTNQVVISAEELENAYM